MKRHNPSCNCVECRPKPASAPREWVIDDAYDLVAGPHPGKERITVVEKSAYDALAAKHEELRKWLENIISVNPQNRQAQLARKALKGLPHE